jgi:DNA helicase-2/ATP-dependent DNA helicase PcrA
MTRAMNTLVLTRAHYRRRYGNDAPEMSIPSRFLEEVPSQLIENLGGRSPAWSTPAYSSRFGSNRRQGQTPEFTDRHYNYEDESQERPRTPGTPGVAGRKGLQANRSEPFVAPWMTATAKPDSPSRGANPIGGSEESGTEKPDSIDNIARFFSGRSGSGKPGAFARPASSAPSIDLPESAGATGLRKGQRVYHSKYGEGTVLLREGDGEDAKLTVLFSRHGMKKLMEKFANLRKI